MALAETAKVVVQMDLAVGPLLRVAWIRRGRPHSDRLYLVIHHLAVDGVAGFGATVGDVGYALAGADAGVITAMGSP
jgi:hypothetical protein